VAYRDWSDQQVTQFEEEAYQSIYNNIPAVPYLDDDSDDEAREMFRLGWLTFGLSQEEVESYRQQFYDMVYIPENLFRALGFWAEYRALYSEVDTA
jgi:hypothetical protein